jgi:hypothetical protein
MEAPSLEGKPLVGIGCLVIGCWRLAVGGGGACVRGGAFFENSANFRRSEQGWFGGGRRIRGIFVFGETKFLLMLEGKGNWGLAGGNCGGVMHLN